MGNEVSQFLDLEALSEQGMLEGHQLTNLSPHSELPPELLEGIASLDTTRDIVISRRATEIRSGSYATTSTTPYLFDGKEWEGQTVLLLGESYANAFDAARFFETMGVVADVTQMVPSPKKFPLFRTRVVDLPDKAPMKSYVPERVYEASCSFFNGVLYVVRQNDLGRLFAPGIRRIREKH